MRIVVTRKVSPSLANCELTHMDRVMIDADLASRQHGAYENALSALNCDVRPLPAVPDLPDSVFVEDAAIVLDELAVITRPGAESRRPETTSIAAALRPYRTLFEITPPGTLDGGDVLRVGRTLYIGLSGRSNRAALEQLQSILTRFGYSVIGVPVKGCLHLKSAVTQVAPDALLINPAWISSDVFRGAHGSMRQLQIAPGEDYAANALLIGTTILYPTSFPRTRSLLEDSGIPVSAVDVSELQKAEGAVTCCSLVFEVV